MTSAAAVSELFLFAGAAFSRLAEQTTLSLRAAEDGSGRLKWTSAELQMLRQCVARHGPGDLLSIAETLRTKSAHQIKAQIRRSQLMPAKKRLDAKPAAPKRSAAWREPKADDAEAMPEPPLPPSSPPPPPPPLAGVEDVDDAEGDEDVDGGSDGGGGGIDAADDEDDGLDAEEAADEEDDDGDDGGEAATSAAGAGDSAVGAVDDASSADDVDELL